MVAHRDNLTGLIKTRPNLTGLIKTRPTLTGKINNSINYVYPPLENLKITPTMEEQVFNHSNSYGYDNVTVEAIISENLNILPTLEEQEFNGLYDNIKVNPVTNAIDENIISENIRAGVNILGVEGTLEEGYKVNITDNTLVFGNDVTVEGSELII